MLTIGLSLQSISAYPIPMYALETIASTRDLMLEDILEPGMTQEKDYRLAKADVLMWLSTAPNISEGGQSYSFSEDERTTFRKRANAIYGELEEASVTGTTYGYKGSRL